MRGRGTGKANFPNSVTATTDKKVGFSGLVKQMINDSRYDLDLLFSQMQQTTNAEIFSYILDSGDVFHQLLKLLDLCQDSQDKLHQFIDKFGDCISRIIDESKSARSELLFSLFCRLPLDYFEGSADPLSPRLSQHSDDKNSEDELWLSVRSAPHLLQASLLPVTQSLDFYLQIDSTLPSNNLEIGNNATITQKPVVPQAPTNARKLVKALCVKLLGINYPQNIQCDLIQFIRDIHTKSPLVSGSYNDWLVANLTKNFSRPAADKVMGMLAALYCKPSDEYRAVCAENITLFSEQLVHFFMYLDKHQEGISSEITSLFVNKLSLLGSTICAEFDLDPKKLAADAFERALRLNIALSANKIINAGIVQMLSESGGPEIVYICDDVSLLNLYFQNLNQLMIAITQVVGGARYRGQVINSTRDFLKKIGFEPLAQLVAYQTTQGANVFHQLALLVNLDFVLDILRDLLDDDVLANALTLPDNNGATPFHYACFIGNEKFVAYLRSRDDLERLRQAGKKVTRSHGFNVFHMASILQNDGGMRSRIAYYLGDKSVSLPALHNAPHSSAINIMRSLIQLYSDEAGRLLCAPDMLEISPFAYCCLTGSRALISESALAFKTRESKLDAVRLLIEPTKPSRNIIAVQLMDAFGSELGTSTDCIEILSVLLLPTSEEDSRLFVIEDDLANKNLTESKDAMVHHFLGFNCPSEIVRCLKEIISKSNATVKSSATTYKGKILPIILGYMSNFESIDIHLQLAVLILALYTKVGAVPSQIEQQCVHHCKNNKEIFSRVLLEFNRLLSQQKPNSHFQFVGMLFSNPSLLRAMVCGAFDILDDSLKQILMQWSLKDASELASLRNNRGHNFLRALLLKLASINERPEAIGVIAEGVCQFAGRDLISHLARHADDQSDTIMHFLSDHPNLHCIAASLTVWLDPTELTEQLSAFDGKSRSVLTRSCDAFNAEMLCYLNRQLDVSRISDDYPCAQNILHAFLLHLTQGAIIQEADASDRIVACLEDLLKVLGRETLCDYVEQALQDGRIILHLIAEFPDLYFMVPFFEALLGRERIVALSAVQNSTVKSVLTVACERQNSAMLCWTVKTLPTTEEELDIKAIATGYASPMHYVCATGDLRVFEYLRKKIGDANLKCLIDNLDENIFNLICVPNNLERTALKLLFNTSWNSQSNIVKVPRLQAAECLKKRNLLAAVATLYDPEALNKKAFDSVVMILACCWCDVELVNQCLHLFSTPEDRQTACLRAPMASGVAPLYSCYLGAHTGPEDLRSQSEILSLLCQVLSSKLSEVVIRPLSTYAPSLIDLSLSTNNIITDYLLRQESPPRALALLFEICRGHLEREDVLLSQPRELGDSQTLTITQEIRASRRKSMRVASLPESTRSARAPSPRRGRQSRSQVTVMDATNNENLVALIQVDPRIDEKKNYFIQSILGLSYPIEILQKAVSIIREAYFNSSPTEESPESILINALANSKFVDEDPLTPYAKIVLAQYCQIDQSTTNLCEQFIEDCRANVDIFSDLLMDLIERITQASSTHQDLMVNQLLTPGSLLHGAIVSCLGLSDQQELDVNLLLSTLYEQSLQRLETKLARYLEPIAKMTTEKLRQAKGARNILHYMIGDLAGSIITQQHADAVTEFIAKLLAIFTNRGVLEEMVLELNKDKQNILHLSLRKSLSFLIKLFRERVSAPIFSQLIVRLDNAGVTPLHIAFEMGDLQGCEEISAGATAEDLKIISQVAIFGQNCNMLYTAEEDEKQSIMMSLAMSIGLYIEEVSRFNAHFAQIFAWLSSAKKHEDKIVKLRDHQSGDTIFLMFLRKLAKSGLSADNIQAQFKQFAESAGEPLLQKLIVLSNAVTQETILHILAKEKSLSCLLSLFEEKIGAIITRFLQPDSLSGETPFHSACRFKNAEFMRFLRRNLKNNELVKNCGAQQSSIDGYNVFHTLAVSCFNQFVWDLKEILEGVKPPPDQPLSRWLLKTVVVSNDVYEVMVELMEIYGDNAIPMMCVNDRRGNNFINLLAYLNNPTLFNYVLTASLGDTRQMELLTRAAMQGLPKTLVTPVQVLSGFGSAETLSKLLFILGKKAEDACLQVNQYMGGRNALRFCYVSAYNHEIVWQLTAFTEVVKLLISRMPPISESELFHEVYPNVSLLTRSVQQDECVARTVIFETVHRSARGAIVGFSHPVELMMSILFDPPIHLVPDEMFVGLSPRSPRDSAFFTGRQHNDLPTKKTDFRIMLVKQIFGVVFIPPALLEKMVRLVTDARLKQPMLFDQRLLLNALLCECLQPISHADVLKNHACLFLASINLVSAVPGPTEEKYCQLFSDDPDASLNLLGDFLIYLDGFHEENGKQFLFQLCRGDSLLKRAILPILKDHFNDEGLDEESLEDEEQFADEIYNLVSSVATDLTEQLW